MVFSSLSLPCFEAFPHQQTQPNALRLEIECYFSTYTSSSTVVVVDKKYAWKISSECALNDLGFVR